MRWSAARNRSTAWPLFVTFGNPNDPKTVREVSPDSIGISRITIEITKGDVTVGIGERLPWRQGYGEKRLSGARFTNPQSAALGDHLSAFSFSTEPTE